MTKDEIKDVLGKHLEWLRGESVGKRADLQGAYLQRAYLQGAYLQGAYLQGAYLQGADLQGADLRGAYLQGAYLRGAYLRGAYLQRSDLQGADLQGANLQRSDLQGADLRGAYLQRSDLQGADLQGANLRGANLQGADLRGAIIDQARFTAHLVCPESGAFTAWKKGADGCLIKLHIPHDAKRMTSLVGRKCRASRAKVQKIWDSDGKLIDECRGWRNSDFVYRVGVMAIPDQYDPDIRVECSNGIHFFITRKEAEEWD